MRINSLTLKLTLSFLVVSLAGIALVSVLIGGITSLEFNRLLVDRGQEEFSAAAARYYANNGSWDGVESALAEEGLLPGPGNEVRGQNAANPPFALLDPAGRVIAAGEMMHRDERMPVMRMQGSTPLRVNGELVGRIVATGQMPARNMQETRFLRRIFTALLAVGLGSAAAAVVLGLFLARSITRPLLELTAASRRMAAGQPPQPVVVRSNDELGELTRSFNRMNADLEKANQLRRQMTADIAHDLRSPLAVMTGYLESLKDGVLKPTSERFETLHSEALYLQRLVEDLRLLSLADAGELTFNRVAVQPAELIERLAAKYQHPVEKAGLRMQVEIEAGLETMEVDPDRMMQALDNLMSNAIRWTPAGGEIRLAAGREDGQTRLEIADSGAGIAEEILPHVFERFYRGESARQDSSSGLGLAITRSIIELQGGRIRAESDGQGKGSRFVILMG